MRQLNLKKYIGLCAGHCLIGSNARPVFFLNDFFLSNALVDICFEIKKKKQRRLLCNFWRRKEKRRKEERPTRTNRPIVADMCYIERKRM
jgi:hypothetical protein